MVSLSKAKSGKASEFQSPFPKIDCQSRRNPRTINKIIKGYFYYKKDKSGHVIQM